jgi:hypothetical protein
MASVDGLFEQLRALQQDQRHPPVHRWHPEHEGEIDIRITSAGEWIHEGGRIQRKPLVKLFSSILRRDPDGYFLVTPVEKLRITVEDAPFVAIDVEQGRGDRGSELLFTTNVGDIVTADADHPVWLEGDVDHPRPYLMVRDGLAALISRPLFYRLVEMASDDADGCFLESRGARFALS